VICKPDSPQVGTIACTVGKDDGVFFKVTRHPCSSSRYDGVFRQDLHYAQRFKPLAIARSQPPVRFSFDLFSEHDQEIIPGPNGIAGVETRVYLDLFASRCRYDPCAPLRWWSFRLKRTSTGLAEFAIRNP